ncbi:MAG TPA: LamG-like jellyroll fold domain-containing protein, partial [Chitinophaga sp.]|uniref:LamG-like jellyroll fold domain-containing protein n=1 Tax=Chitinophaga sp. TaxID=1869181 RepID=UPI002F949F9E
NWMRVFDFGNNNTQYMFLSVQAGTTTVNNVSSSIVRYAIKNGGTELNVSAPYVFPLNTWVHLAVTQSGDTARLYINGALVSGNTALNIKPSQLTPAGAATGTTLNYLGKSQFSDPVFNGAIDEFKIYSRALSDGEIAAGINMNRTAVSALPVNGAGKGSSRNVIVYPNPVTDVVNVKVSGGEAGAIIRIYNHNGTLVKTLLMAGPVQAIPVRGLTAGMYYLQINTRGVITVKKIVKL